MTPKIIIGGLLLLLFTVKRKERTAVVTAEDPTVSGPGTEEFGGTDYGTETLMQRLIRESNALGQTTTRDGQTGLVSPDNDDLLW